MTLLGFCGILADFEPPGLGLLAVGPGETQAEPVEHFRVVQLVGRRQPFAEWLLEIAAGYFLRGFAELVGRESFFATIA